MPRRRRRLSVTGLSVAVATVALMPMQAAAQTPQTPTRQAAQRSQTATPQTATPQTAVPDAIPDLLQPSLDGNPDNPPRFRKPGSAGRTLPGQTPGKFITPAPSRIGATPLFGSPPAFGAGNTGFDSTNDPRRKAKKGTQKPANPNLAPSPLTTFTPLPTAKPAVPPKPPAKPPARTQPDVHPATAAARPGAILPALPEPIPLSNPPPEVHPRVSATRPGATLPVPPPVTTPLPTEGAASSPPPGLPPPNTLPPGTPAQRRLPAVEDDPYDALGLRAGSFLLRPAIELSTGYDSNPPRIPGGGGSAFFVVAPELAARSNWSRHALNADIRGSYTEYAQPFTPSLNRPYLDSRINGRIDVTRDTQINLENRFLVSTDNPGSPNLQAGLAKLPINTTLGGTLGVAHQFGRFDLAVKSTFDRTVYQNSQLTDGSTDSNADRNFNQYAGILRGGYEVMPGFKPFIEVSRDSRIHDLEFDRSNLQRDSVGTSAKLGSAFGITRVLTGEFALGYLKRTYQDPTLPDISGLTADGSLVWQATGLTTVKLAATSATSESVLAGVSGSFSRDLTLQVDHAFRRWLIGTLKGGYGRDNYVGSDPARIDNRFFASIGATYKLTRTMQIRGELRQDWLHSSVSGVDYTATAVLVGLRLQR